MYDTLLLVRVSEELTSTPAADVEIFTSVESNGETNYACFAHPEYASADGLTQYSSYYQTGTGAQRLVKVVLS